NAGRPCTRRKYREESAKRVKTVDVILDENTVHQAKLYLEVKQEFLVRVQ
ncbi:hypothetical protein PAPHI01_2799, partial [Pancytospora philotis]